MSHKWTIVDGTPESLPREGEELILWSAWRIRNKVPPSEITVYLAGTHWISEDDQVIDELSIGDQWILWKDIWKEDLNLLNLHIPKNYNE